MKTFFNSVTLAPLDDTSSSEILSLNASTDPSSFCLVHCPALSACLCVSMFLLKIFIFEMKPSADNPTPYFWFFINRVQMSVNTPCFLAKSDGFLFAQNFARQPKQDNASSVSRTCATSLSQYNLLDYTVRVMSSSQGPV